MSIASELQDKINSKAAIKAAIEAKGVTVGNVKLNQYAAKIDEIEQGGGDPSIPVGTGQHLVTFYDFDGKVLKRQKVNTGENAIAPAIPTHQYLTFAEWNNPFTNVQSDIDTGAIYNTTDGKTYLFITLTAVTGLAPTLYFSKSSTSLMTIDWGDGTTSTSTTSGNQSIQHTYATAGDYIITIENSSGGTLSLGGTQTGAIFGYINQGYHTILKKCYCGINIKFYGNTFDSYFSLTDITFGSARTDIGYLFYRCTSLKCFVSNGIAVYGCGHNTEKMHCKVIIKNSALLSNSYMFYNNNFDSITIPKSVVEIPAGFNGGNLLIKRYEFHNGIVSIGTAAFSGNISVVEYVFLSLAPPTLTNINAFTGINPICKIYVPDASVNAYKTATNWVTYANYIYPLSQKPQSDE